MAFVSPEIYGLVTALRAKGFTDPEIQELSAITDPAAWQTRYQAILTTKPQIPPPAPPPAPPPTPPPAPPPPPVPVPPGPTPDESARGIITATLTNYGLGSLAGWAWERYLTGVPVEMIMVELRARPEYQARFPAMAALAASGHALSEAAYIDYERTAAGLMHQYGLPTGFYDQPGDFTQLLANNVSVGELAARVSLEAQVVVDMAADPANRQVMTELQQYYGIDTGHLLAYALDPGKALPVIQAQFAAATIGAQGRQVGYALNVNEAESIAAIGMSSAQARTGLAALAQGEEAFAPLALNRGEAQIGRDIQIGALLGEADAMTAVESRTRARVAPFQGGGKFVASGSKTGIGTAP